MLSPAAQVIPLPYIWGVAWDFFGHTKFTMQLWLIDWSDLDLTIIIKTFHFQGSPEIVIWPPRPLEYMPCCHDLQHTGRTDNHLHFRFSSWDDFLFWFDINIYFQWIWYYLTIPSSTPGHHLIFILSRGLAYFILALYLESLLKLCFGFGMIILN